jgi:hypothetical protein
LPDLDISRQEIGQIYLLGFGQDARDFVANGPKKVRKKCPECF